MADTNSTQDNSILQATLESEAVKAYQNAQATPQQIAAKMTAFPGQSPPPSPQTIHQENQHPSPPKMFPVTSGGKPSSTIKLVGYDPKGQTLHVIFHSGPATYTYSGFSSKKFAEFMNSKSKGEFHSKEIKGKFRYHKVKPTPPLL